MPSPRPNSTEMINRPKQQYHPADDNTDKSTDVEARFADLSAKIDRLTALVVALQPTESIEFDST